MIAQLPTPNPTVPGDPKPTGLTNDEVVQILEGYRQEAEGARKGGPNNRDDKWEDNWNLYWNRFDFSKKASWQAKETLPEVPAFVDRFAASLKEALNATPSSFYTVNDDTDAEGDLAQAVKRATDVWLSRCGRNQMGQITGFSSVFEEQMKMGAIMSTCALVTWKEDVKGGRVSIETQDPRSCWLDHTGRSLYRVRRIELDMHDLKKLVGMKDGAGKSIYHLEELEKLTGAILEEERLLREQSTGHGQETTSVRKPVVLHEYLASILDHEGELVADQGLSIVANNKFIIRGPEKNPFWHGQDWLLMAPLIPVPLSPYGRSYMEDFGALAKTFNELSNLILDAATTSAMKSFALTPSMLLDPNQVAEGMVPNKLWLLEDGVLPKDFLKEIDLGTLDASAVTVWQMIKNELTEAAHQNEVGLGQFAPKGRTSATEVVTTQQSTSAIVRSIASNVEELLLNPMLDLVWKTGFQHVSKKDTALRAAIGSEMFDVLLRNRKEVVSRHVTFSARGISTLIQKSQRLQSLMTAMQIMASNEVLLKVFLQKVDPGKLSELILDLLDIDISRLQLSERERLVKGMTEDLEQRRAQAEEATKGQTAEDGQADQAGQAASIIGAR